MVSAVARAFARVVAFFRPAPLDCELDEELPYHISIESMLRMNGNDPMMLAAVTTLLLVVAIGACLIPAYRATRVDPLTALRAD